MQSAEFYTQQLYPLQDKALGVLTEAGTDFYLSGGTALSRGWLHHRFSDDLDLFTNNCPDFRTQVNRCLSQLERNFVNGVEVTVSSESYLRAFVRADGTELKIEFVNDVPFRVGDIVRTPLFHRTDTVRNILSNKLSALQRNEPKDVADLLVIARTTDFNWQDVVSEAKQKDMWVDEAELVVILSAFDLNRLQRVNWAPNVSIERVKQEFTLILQDIVEGGQNRLFQS